MTEILKPCPFCGGEADLRYCLGDNYSVLCEKCLARTATYNTVKKAVKAWNKRANDKRLS